MPNRRRSGEAQDETEIQGKKRQGPPPGWDLFLKEKYEDGKRLVSNPNPDTRDRYPKIQFGSALKFKDFMRKAIEEYKRWAEQNKDKIKGEKGKGKKGPEAKEFVPFEHVKSAYEFGKQWGRKDPKIEANREGVLNYSSSAYMPINNHLRKGEDLPDYLQQSIEQLDDVFKSPSARMPEPIAVTRKAGTNHPLVRDLMEGRLKVGDVFQDKGFVSTTIKDPKSWSWDDGVTMIINVPKGAKALWMGEPPSGWDDRLSNHSSEQEVLLPRGTKIKVGKLDPASKTIHFDLVED